MTDEERTVLRDAARAVTLRDLGASSRLERWPTEDRWKIQTSNSFRRIGARGDGDVLCATSHPYDRHPDLSAAPGVLDYIVAAQPLVILALLDYVDAIEAKLDRLGEIEQQLDKMRVAVEQALKEVSR